ncbi:hypothetical protein IQ265_23875 [Nodosilinea sp. LEGE 06152]|uniref:hypothetical protein n=1 Tax=Nodosilinea sp. LEGE 06152 TaxID=2777966 RepID=UPI001881B1D1|nr:hypothetical protein [Nodosilinea sp. LEGE 06152]MBE9159848.1 hypothetical protein [Nodosilinea sp. LEGE 06152]
MTSFTFKTKTLMALVGLLALGTTAVGAVACAPLPDSGATPGETVESPSNSEVPPYSGELGQVDDVLTPEVRETILQTVAADVDRPVADLRIAAAETATWDGCMGIYVPDQMCTMIAISGLRLVVTDGEQSWVYHTREDGQQAVQNSTASGSQNSLITDFIPQVEGQPTETPEAYVFRSVVSGSLAGRQQAITLYSDGRLLQTEGSTLVADSQVTPEQLEAFQQVLEDQRFPNLNRMRYITDAAFADYPTVRLSTQSAQSEYIDLAIADAPVALQAVVQAWETLVAEAQ